MKPLHYLVLSLGLTLGLASAATEYEIPDTYTTVWAQNVNENGGWYDVNKVSVDDGHVEANMCYAASASNLIAWWQNIYCENQITSTTPPDVNDIWQQYIKCNALPESGGHTLSAINWWISGVYAPLTDDGTEWAPEGDEKWDRFFGTYEELSQAYDEEGNPVLTLNYPYTPTEQNFYDLHGLQQSDVAELLVFLWTYDEEEPASFDVDFAEIFGDGAGITLSIQAEDDAEFAHAITMWGVTYDEEGQVAGLWLTDSDDFYDPENGLFFAEVDIDEEDGRLFFTDADLYGSDQVFVSGVFALDASWRMVPEPATATLSLLALCGLAARRRRR